MAHFSESELFFPVEKSSEDKLTFAHNILGEIEVSLGKPDNLSLEGRKELEREHARTLLSITTLEKVVRIAA